MEMERKEIEILQKAKNYHPQKYLAQFNPCFRQKLIAAMPLVLNYSLSKDLIKTKLCNCVKCGKNYKSEQSAEEMGMCWSCHFELSEKCLAMSPPQDCDKINSRKKATKIFPHHIGKQNIFAIRKFFCENMNVKFSKKNQSPGVIREHFSCASKLKDAEVLAMLDINALRKAGLIYEFRKYSN